MATRSSLEGVAALTKQLIALQKLDDGKVLKSAVKAGINEALKKAQEYVPVGTVPHRTYQGLLVAPGFAKSQLRTIATINAAKNVASGLLGVRKAAYYILQYVEFGTRFQRAQPFIRRALMDAREDAEAKLRGVLQKAVDKAARTT
jgi:HK97 gp10 family phage protein